MKREKFFIHLVANLVLAFAILAVALGGAYGVGVLPVSAVGQKAIYRGNSNVKRVSLMVNVYWGEEYLAGMLDVLARTGQKATFFVGGSWAEKNANLLRRIVAEGHELGNHGYLHKDPSGLSYQQNKEEILLCHRLVKELTGVEMNLFAPPSGDLGEEMFRVCRENGYRVIMWSKDTIDWRDKDEDLALKRATTDTQNGDLILMHPTAHTLKALPLIIENLITQGYKLTTVTENLTPTNDV